MAGIDQRITLGSVHLHCEGQWI